MCIRDSNNTELFCENSGSCVVKNGRIQCMCQEGYSGETCQLSIIESTWSTRTLAGKYTLKQCYNVQINVILVLSNILNEILHIYCLLLVCPEHYLNCGNSTCITRDKWCDGVSDCPDNIDETINCSGYTLFYQNWIIPI